MSVQQGCGLVYPKGLKATQAYPPGYGVATALLMKSTPIDLEVDSHFDLDLLEAK